MHIIQRLALAYREHNVPGGHDGSADWPAAYACLMHIMQELSQIPCVQELKYFGVSGSKSLQRFDSWEALIQSLPTWKKDVYRIAQVPSGASLCRVDVMLRGGYNTVTVSIKGEKLEKVKETIIPGLVQATMKLYPHVKRTFSLTNQAGIEIYNVSYPKVKPPRESPIWGFSRIVDYFDLVYYQESLEGRREEVNKLLAAELPKGVKKIEQNGLIVLLWVDDLEDSGAIEQQLHRRDQWLTEHLDLPIESGYNEQGDAMEAQFNLEVHPPLTFYSRTFRVGYKATAIDADGSVDEDLLYEVGSWIEESALPDGTPLEQVNLLLPNRQSALRISGPAQSIGVGKALYVDNDGNWWDPDPLG